MGSIAKPTVFQFTELKVNPKKGLEVKWSHSVENGVEKNHENFGKKSDVIPHPDLTNAIRAIKKLTMDYFCVHEEDADTIRIDGVLVSMHETTDKKSVQVKATRTIDFAGATQGAKINTPKIVINEMLQEVESILNTINNEVEAYVFDGKQAQLEMAFGEDVAEKIEKEVEVD